MVGGGYGVAFVFKYSDWIEQSGTAAGLTFFANGGGIGPYLNYGC